MSLQYNIGICRWYSAIGTECCPCIYLCLSAVNDHRYNICPVPCREALYLTCLADEAMDICPFIMSRNYQRTTNLNFVRHRECGTRTASSHFVANLLCSLTSEMAGGHPVQEIILYFCMYKRWSFVISHVVLTLGRGVTLDVAKK